MKKINILFFLFTNFIIAQNKELELKDIIQNFSDQDSNFAYNVEQLSKYFSYNKNAPQFYLNGLPIYYKTSNLQSATMLNANKLYPSAPLGLNVNGSNVIIAIWDEDKVLATHQELSGKFVYGDNSSNGELSDHATHVSGTAFGRGARSDAKGISYGSSGITYDWSSDVNEMRNFASSFTSSNGSGLVSNHSYGLDIDNLPNYYFGKYIAKSREVDDIMYSYPYYQIVCAAGNDRNENGLQYVRDYGGYDLLTSLSVAKNVIVVGAIQGFNSYDPTNVLITSFSNYGPTDDGRVKPDFVAKGIDVFSAVTNSNSSYSSYPGTSMASPAITGLIALLQDHHYITYNRFMKSSMVRALLVNSVRDTGTRGPDYEYGWGLPDAEAAANVISDVNKTYTLLEDFTLNNNSIFEKEFVLTSQQNIEVTIAWTDPAYTVESNTTLNDRTPVLVNDLDIKIVKLSPDNIITNTYYPWKLNPQRVENRATNNSANDVDNIEKVNVYNATAGRYKIIVSHKNNLLYNNQEFSLVANFPQGFLSTQTFDQANLKLYPNPATDNLFIEGEDLQLLNDATIEIYSIDGKLAKKVKTIGYSRAEINISDLNSGFYIVKLNGSNKSFTTKFIKK